MAQEDTKGQLRAFIARKLAEGRSCSNIAKITKVLGKSVSREYVQKVKKSLDKETEISLGF